MADEALAPSVSDLDRADLPGPVANRASLVAADTIGAVLGGASDPTVAALAHHWANGNGGESTVTRTAGERTTAYRAAFANAATGGVLELDEGHRFAASHPATHVLSAFLADGESVYRSGDEFLTTFVVGCEAAVRTAEAVVPLADGLHPHGMWGGVGTTATVARPRGLDAETTLGAMRIAANYAQHTWFEAATEDATVRDGYVGMSNLLGLLAVDQAESGFTGPDDGVARHLEPVTADGPDRSALADGLGEYWEIERGYFKVHAVCRYTCAAFDAAALLVEETGVGMADIDTVTAEMYLAAAALLEPASRNALQAKFSAPFVVASALTIGEIGKGAFTDEVLTKTAFGFARYVDVVATGESAARTPDECDARVTTEMADGKRYAHGVHAARGGEHGPVTKSESRAKFGRFVVPVIGDGDADSLWTAATEPAAPRVPRAPTWA